jgi:radical SAM protein with 4Fe4S-binding SPASM domain
MTPKDYLTKKNFCVLPWTGVFIQPDGVVRSCAVTPESIGNINDNSLENILHGEKNQIIKQDMSGEVFHNRCHHCYHLEKNQQGFNFDQVSNRVWYLKSLRKTDLSVFDKVDNFQLKQLDLRWKNTCNFACVYCGPDLSSTWADELKQPQYLSDKALQTSLEFIYKNLATVDHIYLAGGEPLLIKENITLLENIKKIKPDIEIRINTNLSIINNKIYNLLKTFKNVHWTVSVDSTHEQFEYTRYGGKWTTFLSNLEVLRQDFEKINFNMTWFVLNSKSILDCIDYLLNLGFHENTIIVNPLDNPVFWNVNNLPDTVLEGVRNVLKEKISQADPQYCLYNSLGLMLNCCSEPFDKHLEKTFAELEKLDQRRGVDSSKIFTELYKLKEGN